MMQEKMQENGKPRMGQEIPGYCKSCELDAMHTVLTLFEGDIRSVQCSTCRSIHTYRPPREDLSADSLPNNLFRQQPEHQLESLSSGPSASLCPDEVQAYSPQVEYNQGDIFTHSSFGIGFVSTRVGETKIEATFSEGKRLLVHNRPDLGRVVPSEGNDGEDREQFAQSSAGRRSSSSSRRLGSSPVRTTSAAGLPSEGTHGLDA